MNSFDPFKYQNCFHTYKLKIKAEEINQVLILVKNLNTGNQKTTYNYLNVLNFPLLKKLKKQITDILDKHSLLLTDNWAQLYNKKNSHGVHTHGGSVYSGIFYIQGSSPTIFYDRDYESYVKKFIKNELLLFPSWIPHEVKPLEIDEQRLIISFNTMKCKK
tara:strand:- start:159 stop:641 length:483 start_codon:yes stop_codon:yes gene_type:complete